MADILRAYRPIKGRDGSTDSLISKYESDGESHLVKETHGKQPWFRLVIWLEHLVVAASLITVAVVIFQLPSDRLCAKRLSAYSTAMDIVEYRDVKFNGTIEHLSIYKGEPSPELDNAWDALVFGTKLTAISAEAVEKLGKSVQPSLVKFMDEDGGGYMTTMEVTHQLHCLNLLRKSTYYDYYKSMADPLLRSSPDQYRLHLNHCIDILRQQLMCTADAGLITYQWVKGYERPYPDFSTWHKCRAIDKLWEWNEEHAVHVPWSRIKRVEQGMDLEGAP